MDSLKKRELLNNHNEPEVSLVDVTNKLLEAAPDLAKLEVNNNINAIHRSIRNLVDAKNLINDLNKRLRDLKAEIRSNPRKRNSENSET